MHHVEIVGRLFHDEVGLGHTGHQFRRHSVCRGRLGQEPFSWGRESLTGVSETRTQYVAAFQAADYHDIGPLSEFARS